MAAPPGAGPPRRRPGLRAVPSVLATARTPRQCAHRTQPHPRAHRAMQECRRTLSRALDCAGTRGRMPYLATSATSRWPLMGLLLANAVLTVAAAASDVIPPGSTTQIAHPSSMTAVRLGDAAALLPRFSNVFQSHMVLQRDAPVKVWGFASGNGASDFVVTLCKQSAQGDCEVEGALTQKVAPANGSWSAVFPAQRGSTTPMLLLVGAQKLTDVVFGDVLLFS